MLTAEETFIKAIFSRRAKKGDDNTKTLANTTASFISDTLSGDNIYIGELLQNADDAVSPSAKFILSGEYLIFTHQGKHFDEADITAICDAANPKRGKIHDSQQIGNKGIGFKSVFSMASSVTIISNKYSFRFDENYVGWQNKSEDYPWQIIPIWTNKNELPEPVKAFCNDDGVQFIFRIRDGVLPNIVNSLSKLTSRHLLFLRHIKKLDYSIYTEDKITSNKKISLEVPKRILTQAKQNDDCKIEEIKISSTTSWYIYKVECPLPQSLLEQLGKAKNIPEKYKAWKTMPISIAVLVNDNKLEPITTGQQVFCYLPTNLNFGLKFNINAEFLLNTSRMGLREDNIADAWNGFILENIIRQQVKFLSILATESELWPFIFNVLSKPEKIPEPFKDNCEKSFTQAISKFSLVTNLPNETIYLVKNIVIDSHNFIAEFGNKELQETCANNKMNNRLLIKSLGAKCFLSADIIKVIQEPWFLKKIKNPKENSKFIEFCSNLYIKVTNSEAREKLVEALQKGQYILSSQERFKKISEIYFPDPVFEDILKEFNFIELIHPLLAQSSAKNWLITMGAKNLAFEDIIAKANKSNDELVAFTLHTAKNLAQYKDEQQVKLKRLQVKTYNGKIVNANICYLPDAFDPKIKIEKFVDSNNELFLHSDYVPNDRGENDKDFLVMLGVNQTIDLNNLALIVKAVNTGENSQKLIKFTEFVFKKFYINKSEEKKNAFLKAVKELKVVTQQNNIIDATGCYLSDCYMPKQKLEEIIDDPCEFPFISNDYSKPESDYEDWNEFFLKLGVRDSIKLIIHQDANRNELIGTDPLAATYFNYLETHTNNGNLYSSNTRSYMYQHQLTGAYIQIDFSEQLFTTSFFWQLLIKNWDSFAQKIVDVTYCTARSEKSVPSNIHYLTNKAIKAIYGDTKSPADYYGHEIKAILQDYTPELEIADITIGLNTQQLRILGFIANLSLELCQSILMKIAATNRYQQDYKKIIFIYQQMLWQFDHEDEDEFEIFEDLLLANQSGQFVPINTLYYIVDNLFSDIKHKNLIKKPNDLSENDFQTICNSLNITLINYAELSPEPQSEQLVSTLKQHIEERIIYILYLEAHKNDWIGEDQKNNSAKLYNIIKGKLAELITYCAETIHIIYQNILAEPVDLWINHEQKKIYHCPLDSLESLNQHTLHQFLHEHLELTIKFEEFDSIMTSSLERLSKKYQSYSGEYKLEDFISASTSLSKKRALEVDQETVPKDKNKKVRLHISDDENESDGENLDTTTESTQSSDTSDIEDQVSSAGDNEEQESTLAIPIYKTKRPTNYSWHDLATTSAAASTSNTMTITKKLPSSISSSSRGFFSERFSKEQRQAIGDRGEKAVYEHLLNEAKKDVRNTIISRADGFIIQRDGYTKAINWPNKRYEDQGKAYKSRAPFDFEIKVIKDGKQKIRHLEVKTSTSTDDNIIEVSYSANEWQLMLSNNQAEKKHHRLFIVRTHITEKGELVIDKIIKKNLSKEISKQRAEATEFMRIKLMLD